MGVTRHKAWMAWIGLWLVASCSTDRSGKNLAQQRFEAFQTALIQRDRTALQDLVCSDARPAIRALCLENREGQPALRVTGVSKRQYDYLVHVADPATSGPTSHFVLTMEDGVMRVDLRATYRDHSLEKRRFLAEKRFVPQRLSPEQIERARVVHSSQAGPAASAGR